MCRSKERPAWHAGEGVKKATCRQDLTFQQDEKDSHANRIHKTRRIPQSAKLLEGEGAVRLGDHEASVQSFPIEVFLMITSHISAADIARLLQVDLTIRGMISPYLRYLARQICKSQRHHIQRDVDALDFWGMDTFSAVYQYAKVLGYSYGPDGSCDWYWRGPAWEEGFSKLYAPNIEDKMPTHVTKNGRDIVHDILLWLHVIYRLEEQEFLVDRDELWHLASKYDGFSGDECESSSWEQYAATNMMKVRYGSKEEIDELLSAAKKVDIFDVVGTKGVSPRTTLAEARLQTIERPIHLLQWYETIGSHHQKRLHCIVGDLPQLSGGVKFCSSSGSDKWLRLMSAAAAGEHWESADDDDLFIAAVLEDLRLCDPRLNR